MEIEKNAISVIFLHQNPHHTKTLLKITLLTIIKNNFGALLLLYPHLHSTCFQVINNDGSAEFVISTNHTFTVSPEFIGSRLLLKMKKMAEKQLGVPIQKAVISVPAEFDERQRNYTVRAANLAGQFNCLL